MRNLFILIFTTVSTLICTDAASQVIEKKSLTLNSLSNESAIVNIELDNVNDRITIKLSPTEKLCINGYRGLVENIRILDNKFISIHYRILGGSDVKMRMASLVCISKGRLYKALNVLSMESYEILGTNDKLPDSLEVYESGMYKLIFNNLRYDKQNFQLSAIQFEKVKYKYDKNRNFEKKDIIKFYFDEKNKVFYTKYVSMKGNYKIEGDGGKNELKKFNGEKYPFIKLRNEEYIFIDYFWYFVESGKLLTEISSSCK